jgi:hypothetical protein
MSSARGRRAQQAALPTGFRPFSRVSVASYSSYFPELKDSAIHILCKERALGGDKGYIHYHWLGEISLSVRYLFANGWRTTLRRAGVPYFRIYDLRSTYATRLSAGGVADEWVTQLLRQGDSQVFKKYSQMKLTMKREALEKLNRLANEMTVGEAQMVPEDGGFGTVLVQ